MLEASKAGIYRYLEDSVQTIYLMLNVTIVLITNKIDITIVNMNKNLSKPRLVLHVETESPPPKAPPAPASDF